MKHLSLKSLLNARLVCRKWSKFVHHHLIVKSDRVILEVYQPWKPSGGHKLNKFIQVMRGGIETCPVSKFVLRNFNSFIELESFFIKFGPIIKSLDLHFLKDCNENGAFRRMLFDYAPCIENLRIECCQILSSQHFWEYSELEAGPSKLNCLKTLYIGNIRGNINLNTNWMTDFFRMTPNLRKIILQVHFKDNGHRFIQQVLESMLQVANLEKIKFLFISSLSQENLQILIKLAEKGLQLKTFKFQDICLHQTLPGMLAICPEAMSTFLQSQSSSLETLRIEQRSNRVRSIVLPKMFELKHLHLVSFDSLHCRPINYSGLFPKLESLILRGYNTVYQLPQYFSSTVNTFPAGVFVRTLHLPSGLRESTFPGFLAQLFPNVKDLEIRGCSNEFLLGVWQSWPRLEVLKIVLTHFDGCLDPGITGISVENCIRIRNEQSYQEVQIEEVQVSRSIADLHGKCST
jgi:hypothetical protein